MTRFLRMALGFFLLSAGLGVVLRFGGLFHLEGFPYGNATHAHSHTLYFGWCALSLFTLFFERVGATDGRVRALLWALAGMSLATFVAFLVSGYGLAGIMVSAASLVVWAFAVVLFFRRARGHTERDVAFLRAAVAYVALASCAALCRVVMLVLKIENPLWSALAVSAFLTTFGGFFLLGLVGLLIHFIESRGAKLDDRMLRWQLAWMAPLTALTFPLSVPGAWNAPWGTMGRVAALLLAVPATLWLVNLWRSSRQLAPGGRRVVRSISLMWALKALLDVGAAFGLASVAVATRFGVVLYLHVTLLGVVSAGLLLLVRAHLGRATGTLLLLHQLGVVVLSLGLALAALALAASLPVLAMGLWGALLGSVMVLAVDAVLVVDGLGFIGKLKLRQTAALVEEPE